MTDKTLPTAPPPLATSEPPLSSFLSLFRNSALLYALFLLPTLLAGFHTGWSDEGLSRVFPGVWQALFWRFPGCSALISRVLLDVLSAGAIIALALLFYQGFRLLSRLPEPASARWKLAILAWPAVCGLLLVAVVPFHSSDIYGYLNRGFQQSAAHTNPYLVTIAEIPGWRSNPLFHAHWIDNPCPYGFFFAQLAAWITGLAGHSFIRAFLLMKTVNLLCLIGATGLIARLAQKLGSSRPWLSAWLFGGNPLVLLHAIGNGHNDILLAFLLMAALVAMESARWRWAALPLLGLSIMTKYASLLALPFVALRLLTPSPPEGEAEREGGILFWKKAISPGRSSLPLQGMMREGAALLIGLGVMALLIVLLGLPYVDPHQPWPWSALLDNAGKPQHSLIDMLAGMVAYPLHWLTGDRTELWRKAVAGFLKPWFWGGFLVFYLWEIRRAFRLAFHTGEPSGPPGLPVVHAIGLVMTVMIALVSAKFHPWYPIMFLPVLLALPETSRLRQFGLTFSLFQLAGFTVFQNLPVFSPLLLTVLPLVLSWKAIDVFSTRRSPE